MGTTEIIRILRQCGSCTLTDCSECPEYTEPEEEGYGFMWSCGGVLMEAADRLEELTTERESGDLISRSALLAELSARLSIVQMVGVDEIVMGVPAVEAEPVVHAHWVIERWSSGYIKRCSCSNCGNHPRDAYDPPKYCDNCGAHMDEEVADE